MRTLITLYLLFMLTMPLLAQDEATPYDIALQRIEAAQNSNATELDLWLLGLTEVPPEIGNLTNLQKTVSQGQ
ncbi:MAG: hypothetical protein Q9P01_18115 [Anaerolineae bacterium]|nr:hypothetical protein [Anaerolineae bacterium]